MVERPKDGSTPSSEPATQHRTAASSAEEQPTEITVASHVTPPAPFGVVEPPTLSSPSSGPHSANPVKELQAKVQGLEAHIEAMERELAEICGAVEHLMSSQETADRTLRQQRYGRYIMWGTLIAILAMLWITLRTRLGLPGPR
ncbi:MAG TPA: hypothetical protein VKP30_33495 [Polyangiaceae bacterium]|nr:hypothetical protein [Polyangiaceae bacterium]